MANLNGRADVKSCRKFQRSICACSGRGARARGEEIRGQSLCACDVLGAAPLRASLSGLDAGPARPRCGDRSARWAIVVPSIAESTGPLSSIVRAAVRAPMGQRSGPSRSLPGRGPGRRRALKPARRTFAPVARAFVSTAKAVAWCRGHYMSIPCWRQFRVCVSVRRGPLSRVRVQGSAGCRERTFRARAQLQKYSRPTGCRAAMCAVCKHVSEATLFSRDRVTSHTHTSR
jgi:hypothetical protein